jgi:hypothetical protein
MIGAEKVEKQGLIGRDLPFNSLKGVPFGTRENPVNVLSESDSRVVGCRGKDRNIFILLNFVHQEDQNLKMSTSFYGTT